MGFESAAAGELGEDDACLALGRFQVHGSIQASHLHLALVSPDSDVRMNVRNPDSRLVIADADLHSRRRGHFVMDEWTRTAVLEEISEAPPVIDLAVIALDGEAIHRRLELDLGLLDLFFSPIVVSTRLVELDPRVDLDLWRSRGGHGNTSFVGVDSHLPICRQGKSPVDFPAASVRSQCQGGKGDQSKYQSDI